MEATRHSFHLLIPTEGLTETIHSGELVGLTGMVFAGTGSLVRLSLPGDTLPLAAGVVATATSEPGLWKMLVVPSVAAVAAGPTTYVAGRRDRPAP